MGGELKIAGFDQDTFDASVQQFDNLLRVSRGVLHREQAYHATKGTARQDGLRLVGVQNYDDGFRTGEQLLVPDEALDLDIVGKQRADAAMTLPYRGGEPQ